MEEKGGAFRRRRERREGEAFCALKQQMKQQMKQEADARAKLQRWLLLQVDTGTRRRSNSISHAMPCIHMHASTCGCMRMHAWMSLHRLHVCMDVVRAFAWM
jgi:hypothetical protein